MNTGCTARSTHPDTRLLPRTIQATAHTRAAGGARGESTTPDPTTELRRTGRGTRDRRPRRGDPPPLPRPQQFRQADYQQAAENDSEGYQGCLLRLVT